MTMMAVKFPGSRLEIMPVCLGRINVNDSNLRFMNNVTRMRFCQCSLEILYQPVQGVEMRIHRDEQLCYITGFSDDRFANAIGLQFRAPFYVDANCLLVPSMAKTGSVQYEIRFEFAVRNGNEWLPISLHQLYGLDPSQWQPTAKLSNGFNHSLWGRGYHPLTNIGNGHDSALYHIRLNHKYGGSQELEKCQQISWDLRIHCRWTEYDPPSSLSALTNVVTVPIIKLPVRSSRPRLYKPREYGTRA